MKLIYDAHVDAAFVEVVSPIAPDDVDDFEELDQDRHIRYDAAGRPIQYEFLNVREYGVGLDDIEDAGHRAELARLFREAGFKERDWGVPVPEWTPRDRHRERSAG